MQANVSLPARNDTTKHALLGVKTLEPLFCLKSPGMKESLRALASALLVLRNRV